MILVTHCARRCVTAPGGRHPRHLILTSVKAFARLHYSVSGVGVEEQLTSDACPRYESVSIFPSSTAPASAVPTRSHFAIFRAPGLNLFKLFPVAAQKESMSSGGGRGWLFVMSFIRATDDRLAHCGQPRANILLSAFLPPEL